MAPSLAVLAIVTLLPSLYLLATSFTPLNLTRPETQWDFSEPLVSYRQLLQDDRLANSVWVQIKLSFWTVTFQLLIGMALALLLNIKSKLLEALRTVFLIPMVLPPIVVAIIWKVIYTPDISPMHGLFRALGWNVPALITDPHWALTSIIIADTWEWFPFTMLMVLAALQMLPQELLDAAKVDGASPWQLTWHVTLPLIQGVLLVAGAGFGFYVKRKKTKEAEDLQTELAGLTSSINDTSGDAKKLAALDDINRRGVPDLDIYYDIVSHLHTIDPDMVVFGGGMIAAGEGFLERIRHHVRALAFPVPAERTLIRYAQLGTDAGFIGAAACGRQLLRPTG